MDDLELLRRYQKDAAEGVFAALVERHVALVYSAARRQLVSPDLARDVTQEVFLELARTAGRLRPDTHVAAWLHVVTRRRAIDMIRRESRRQQREQRAWQESADSAADFPLWKEIAPLLDEGVAALDEVDRRAILLRFFENHGFRDIGATLGMSEDAAQKRVGRALERLRVFLSGRGVTTGGAGLAATLTARAVEPAPPGLGVAIARSASGLVGKGAVVHASISGTQRLMAVAMCAVAVGVMLRETWIAHGQEPLIRSLEARAARWEASVAAAETRAASMPRGPAVAPSTGTDEMDPVRLLARRISLLKAKLATMPGESIPELTFLTDNDWILVANQHPKLDSDPEVHRALADLRNAAVSNFEPKMAAALKTYVKDSGGRLPASVAQLLPEFDPPVDPAILDRYAMIRSSSTDSPLGSWLIEGNPATAVDQTLDERATVGVGSYGMQGPFADGDVEGDIATGQPTVQFPAELNEPIREAFQAFGRANGYSTDSWDDVYPYFKHPEDAQRVRQMVAAEKTSSP